MMTGLARTERNATRKSIVVAAAFLVLSGCAPDEGDGFTANDIDSVPGATTNGPGVVPLDPEMEETFKEWHETMRAVSPPHAGCFEASHPETSWREIPCTVVPMRLMLPARRPTLETVGNGTDFMATVTSGNIFRSTGSFLAANLTSVTDSVSGNPDFYSLQLNSNSFISPACSGASDPSMCRALQQFVFTNDGLFGATIVIQYWLTDYLGPNNGNCPSGWVPSDNDCARNGAAALVENQPITSLSRMTVSGSALAGGFDQLAYGFGTIIRKIVAPDSALGLGQGWVSSEFNLFGHDNGSQANVNSGAEIMVKLTTDNFTNNAPTCGIGGNTEETNNMTLAGFSCVAHAATSTSAPSVTFFESKI